MSEDEYSEDDQRKKLSMKLLLIGDSEVGKTSLLLKYTEHIFPEEHIATIGVEYKDKYIIKDNYNIRLQIWDTAGQERFHSITKNIYRNTNGVIFIYDIAKKETFDNIKNWILDLQSASADIKGIILGNKNDLTDKREVNMTDLKELGEKYKMPYMETSAKNNINVNEGFELIVNELLQDKDENQIMEMFSKKTRSDLSICSKGIYRKKISFKKAGRRRKKER